MDLGDSGDESDRSSDSRTPSGLAEILREHGVVVPPPGDSDVQQMASHTEERPRRSGASPAARDDQARAVVAALKRYAQQGAASAFDLLWEAISQAQVSARAAVELLEYSLSALPDNHPAADAPDQRPLRPQAEQLAARMQACLLGASCLPRDVLEHVSERTLRWLLAPERLVDVQVPVDDLFRALHWWVMRNGGGGGGGEGASARVRDIRRALDLLPPAVRDQIARVGKQRAAEQAAEEQSRARGPAFKLEFVHKCAARQHCGDPVCTLCGSTLVDRCEGTAINWSAQPNKWVLRAGCGARISVRVAGGPGRHRSGELPPFRFQVCLVPATAIREGVTPSEAIDLACTMYRDGTGVKPLLQLDHTPVRRSGPTAPSEATQAATLPRSDCSYFPPQPISRLTAYGLAVASANAGPTNQFATAADRVPGSTPESRAASGARTELPSSSHFLPFAAAASSGELQWRRGESDEALLERATAVVPDLSIAPEGGEATARMHPKLVLAVRAVSSHLRPLDALVTPAFSNPFSAAVRLDLAREPPRTGGGTAAAPALERRDEDPAQLRVHYASPGAERKTGLVLSCSSGMLSLSRGSVLGVYDATADRLTRILAGGWHPYLSVLLSKAQRAWSQPGHPGWALFGSVAPADDSVDALAEFVRELVRRVGGRLCGTDCVIDGGAPIRAGLRCVSCECVTFFGRRGSVLLFATGREFVAHQHLVAQPWFERYKIRAAVFQVINEKQSRDRDTGLTVRVPNAVVTELLAPMDEVLGPLPPPTRSLTVDTVARDLAAQLADLHYRDVVHGGVSRVNVVQNQGAARVWSFREYCGCVREGREVDVSHHIHDVRLAAPEMSRHFESGLVTPSFAADIWQLGTLLFELYTGRPYWPDNASPNDVLVALAAVGGLPHERSPASLEAVTREGVPLWRQQELLRRMLDRRPSARPEARELAAEFAKLASGHASSSVAAILD